jgi:predicted PurR-regulated permease PerM
VHDVEVPLTAEEPRPAPTGGSAEAADSTAPTAPPDPAVETAAPPDPAVETAAPPAAVRPDDDDARFGTPGPALDRRNPFLVGFLAGLGLLTAYGVLTGLRSAASILVLLFIALFIAIGLNPAVVRLRSWGLARGWAVLVVTLVGMLLLCGGVVALIPPLVTQTAALIDNIPDYLQSLQRNQTIAGLLTRYDVVAKVQSALDAGTVATTVSGALGGVVGGAKIVFGTIFSSLTVVVLTIYFMVAFDRIKSGAYALVPTSRRERVQLLTDEILTKVGAYMVGALAIAVVAGLSTWVFGLIVGLAYPFALAVVVAVFDLIPQIGATLGAIVVSLVGLATSLTTALFCVGFFIVYQQIENYLIYPNVMRRSVKVSDVAAVVAALLGGALFGVIGALVAIPMVAAIQLIGREVIIPSMRKR